MTYNNEGSYSNEIAMYGIQINYLSLNFSTDKKVELNACSIKSDTFYVNKIMIVPNSSLALIIAEDIGAYFFDI